MSAKKKAALGRGLSALLENPETDITTKDIDAGKYVAGAVAAIPLNHIETNPFQPRSAFDEEAINELAASIRKQGIIQPITVRKLGYNKYQLISGERRYKAAEYAGLREIPAFIRIANDNQMLEMALVENIQRENLNPIEIAISYQRLIDEINLTQEQLSERIGKNRSTIANFLRLLKLPAAIQAAIKEARITMGHAKALVNIKDEQQQNELLHEIIEYDLSVREVEKLAQDATKKNQPRALKKQTTKQELPEKHQTVRNHLAASLNTRIDIKRNRKGAGNIVISFTSDEDFKRLIDLIGRDA
jgi:ParB family chromosome partitioning protein